MPKILDLRFLSQDISESVTIGKGIPDKFFGEESQKQVIVMLV